MNTRQKYTQACRVIRCNPPADYDAHVYLLDILATIYGYRIAEAALNSHTTDPDPLADSQCYINRRRHKKQLTNEIPF